MVGRYYTEGVEMRGLGKLKARKYNMSFEKWSANWCGWVGAFWGYEVQVASGQLKLILKGRTRTIPWISRKPKIIETGNHEGIDVNSKTSFALSFFFYCTFFLSREVFSIRPCYALYFFFWAALFSLKVYFLNFLISNSVNWVF